MIVIGPRSFATKEDLEALVVHAAAEYGLNGYAEDFDGAEITDPEYDDLYRELKKIYPTSDAFKGTTPGEHKRSGKTVKHEPPMTSIAKADGELTEKESIYKKWLN